jgi:hypothetical protein
MTKQLVLYRMKQPEFQDYQRRIWATFTPDEDGKPRIPNRFEVATGDALFRAVLEAYGPISHEKFTVVSAATGSGKTYSAVALAAYMASKEGRVTLLESQINQLANVYDTLVKVIPREWVAIWSTVHRHDRSERDVQRYLSEATDSTVKHFEDPPRFSLEECRNARVLLTTHASWRQELGGGRDLNIAGSDLILIDEDPALQRVFQFTSIEVKKLAYVFKMGKRDGVAGVFDHEAEAVLDAIHDRVSAVEKAEVRRGRLAGVDIVTTEELRVLSGIDREAVHQYCYSTQQLDGFQELWDTLIALKAAGQGRVFYVSWTGQKRCFYAYATAVGPQPKSIILDASAEYSTLSMSKTIFQVEGVPKPTYDNCEVTFVYPDYLVGRLKPTELYRNRDGALDAYVFVTEFLRQRVPQGEEALIYAKKDLLDMLERDEKEHPKGFEDRTLHWVHFGTGRGFNEWRNARTYLRLGDYYMAKDAAVAHAGSVLNKTFTYKDLATMSNPRVKSTAADALIRLRLMGAAVQDAARTGLRVLDGDGRPVKPVRLFLVDPDPAVVEAIEAGTMFPGIQRKLDIGDRTYKRPKAGDGFKAIKEVHAFLDAREKDGKEWTSKDLETVTGIHRVNVGRTLKAKGVVERLSRWKRVAESGKPWRMQPADF